MGGRRRKEGGGGGGGGAGGEEEEGVKEKEGEFGVAAAPCGRAANIETSAKFSHGQPPQKLAPAASKNKTAPGTSDFLHRAIVQMG